MSGPGGQRKETPEAPGEILARATDRARDMGLPYAGAVTPAEAFALREAGEAAIVDVRTRGEWQFVGHVPDVPLIEWPRGGDDASVAEFLEQVRSRFPVDERILFLCRSGVRSHYAAAVAAQAGYAEAFNVLEGFEGEGGAGDNGWRAAGLPWKKG